MAEVIEMPKMSDTMTEGVIAAWHVKEGDSIKTGQVLAEVETDKATMDLESYFDGVVLHIAAPQGVAVPVTGLIAVVGKAGENIDAILQKYSKAGTAPATTAAPSAQPAALPVANPAVAAIATSQASQPLTDLQATTAATTNESGRIKASPLAKAMAAQKGLDITQLQGTGEGGRIIKRDVDQAQTIPSKPALQVAATATTIAQPEGTYHDAPVSQMRKTIARRLSESLFTAPHFYLTMAIDMAKATEFRKQVNAESESKISFNDLVVKAAAAALRKHPKVNSSWLGDTIRTHQVVNIGVAVAMEEGLLVPVIRNADAKGLVQISTETKELAAKAKNKQLQPAEWEGNTFTISNLGMYGIDEFTAIINPPDACILAVGAIQQVPVVKNGELAVGAMMKVTLSCDHRLVDGATGSAFLQTLKFLLEDPMRILL